MSLLEQHPATAEILVRLGIFPNLDRASRRLRRMYDRGDLAYMQSVEVTRGVRRLLFAKVMISNPLHELQLTEYFLNVKADEIRRLHNVDRRFNADGEQVINGKISYVELDRGTEGYAQVERQMKNYQDAHADVLWIAPTITRMNGLMKRTKCPTFWFTTYEQSLTPHDHVWVNVHGEVSAVPIARGANA